MTFDEIQKTIEGMLAVQRGLQESQVKLSQELIDLKEASQAQKLTLDRLIDYTFASNKEFEERLEKLEAQ